MKKLSSIIKESGAEYLSKYIEVEELISLLKSAFCEEMNAWYQYIIVSPFLIGKERKNIEADYVENAKEELDHAMLILNRINELGGNIASIQRPDYWDLVATHKFIEPTTADVQTSVSQMIEAERGAIETYILLEEYTRDKDVVTNNIVKKILADELKHLLEMEDFLNDITIDL